MDNDSIEELKKTADKHFEKGEYAEALIPYEKLLGLEQSNFEFRYKYGACMLFATGNKQKALEFLEESQGRNGVPSDMYYYLGRAYHLNYRFTQAISAYEKYAQFASANDKQRFQIDRQIEMAKNGEKLLKNVTDIAVITKKNANERKYYELYSLNDIGGTIINAKSVEELRSKLDKKRGQDIIIHLPDQGVSDIVYYASYGESGSNGKDIYQIQRLPSGEWGEPKIVSGGVNTGFDEDFPYMHPDGQHLYFCSKGHNSMGGYDVFRCKLNPDGSFGAAENMDFAVNTPDDDLLYIVDSLDQNAYFASNRENAHDRYHVYNVKVARYPVMMAIVKGQFQNQIDPSKHDLTIEIKDELTGKNLSGSFKTDVSGEYLITLPRSGKYTYIIRSDQSSTVHKKTVTIPYQKKLKILVQEIRMFEHNGEQVEVIDKFSEEHPDNDEILAQLFNNKSKLNPNLDDLKDVAPIGASNETVDLGDMTDQDIIEMAREDEQDIKEKLDETSKKKEAAFAVAGDYFNKALEADKKAKEAADLARKAGSTEEKTQYEQMAKDLIDESKAYAKSATAANDIGQKLEKEEKDLKNDYDVAQSFTNGIRDAIDGSNREETEKKLKAQQAFIMEVIERDNANNDQEQIDMLEQDLETAQKNREKSERTIRFLNDEATSLRGDILDLEEKLKTAKKREKPELETEIAQKKEDLEVLESDISDAETRLAERKSAEITAQNELDLALGNFDATGVKPLTNAEKESLVTKLNSNYLETVIETREKDLEAALNGEEMAGSTPEVDVESDPKYIALQSKADDNDNISDPVEKLEAQIEVDEQWVQLLDNDISMLEVARDNTDDATKKAAIQDQIDQLQNLKTEKQTSITEGKDAIASIESSSEPKNIALEDISPDYEVDYSAASAIADPVARANKEKALNNDLLDALTRNENRIKDELNDNVIDERDADNQLAQIATLRAEVESKIKQNDVVIAQNSSSVVNISPDVGFNDLDAQYLDDKADIESASMAQPEKAEKLNTLNREMIARIDDDIAATQKRLDDGRLDESIGSKRLDNLNNLKDQLEAEIQNNNQVIAAANDPGVGDISTNVSTTDLISDFQSKENEINTNSNLNDVDKAKKLAELNETLLDEINNEVLRTERLRSDGTISNSVAEQRMNSLLDLKSNVESEIAAQKEIMKGGVPTIAINDVSDGFDEQYSSIQEGETDELEKARQLKALNNQAIANIDAEIKETEAKRKRGELTDEQADKTLEQLTTLRETRMDDLRSNSETIANLEVDYDKPINYTSETATANYAATQDSRDKVSGYDQEIAALEIDRENASEKQRKKLDKKIAKLEDKRDAEEIRIGNLIGESNKAEFESLDNQSAQLVGQLKTAGKADESNPDYQKALQHGTDGDNLFSQAQSLRNDAAKTSDSQTKNELIKQAVEKEQQAILQKGETIKTLSAMTDDLYVAGSITDPEVGKEDLTNVSADVEDRKSTQLYDQADVYDQQATDKLLAAATKRQEAAVAKRKDRERLESEALALEKEADQLKNGASSIRAKADDIKSDEEAFLTNSDNGRRNLSQEEEERIRKLSEYGPYYDKMVDFVNAAEQHKTNLSDKASLIETIREDKDRLNSLRLKHALAEDDNQKTELETQIRQQELVLDDHEKQLSDIREETNASEDQMNRFLLDVDNQLETARDENAKSFVELTGADGEYLPEPIVVVAVDPTSDNFEVPNSLNGSNIFKEADGAAYNENNPIPVDASNPSGLVYKVQVGAFRNPIPQDLFADFAPISGERIGNGITRYMVGYFGTFDAAGEARRKIAGFNGYAGSFVVAYIDGKRVSIDEARRYEESNGIIANNDNDPANISDPQIVTQDNGQTITYAEDQGLTRRFENQGDPEEAIQGKGIKGLYFTVQVGAYSTPIQKGDIDVSPLVYFEINGLWKYTTGVFKSVEEATKRKEEVQASGAIPDAFVTAFLNGQKITIAKARALLEEKGESILTGSVDLDNTSDTRNDSGTNQNNPDQNNSSQSNDTGATDDRPNDSDDNAGEKVGASINEVVNGLTYYVLLGKFTGATSREFTSVLLRNLDRVESVKKDDGSTEYRSGTTDRYTTAIDYLEYFEEEGLSGLQIIHIFNGAIITSKEAESLRKGGSIGGATPRGGPITNSRSSEPTPVENLEYELVLGMFDGNAPQEFSSVIYRNSDKGILSKQNESFQTVYYIPNFTTFAQALQMKDYFENEGIENVLIKAYYESEEISLEEAKSMSNE